MGIGGFGTTELILILVVALLVFGAKRLPEIGSALGKGIREFKSSVSEIKSEVNRPDEPRREIHSPESSRPAVPPAPTGETVASREERERERERSDA